MANTAQWDTGISVPAVDGNNGVSRIHRKVSGAWEKQDEIFTKVGGEWKRVNKTWVKQDDEWKPTYWAPKVGEILEYESWVKVISHRKYVQEGCHWNEMHEAKAKYLGGDPFTANNWETTISLWYRRGGPSGEASNRTSGWVTGMASKSYQGVTHGFVIGGDGSRGTDYTTGNHAAPNGSFCPVAHSWGNGECSGPHYARMGYDNYAELYLNYPNTTIWSY